MLIPTLIPIGLMLFVALVLGTVAAARSVRAARRRRRRVVERPNSHHTWQRVREQETRHRWRAMPLDRIHPLNREEVVRLLAKVEVGGVEALQPRERTFLEQIARIAGMPDPVLE